MVKLPIGKVRPVTISFNNKEFILGEVDITLFINNQNNSVSIKLGGIRQTDYIRHQLDKLKAMINNKIFFQSKGVSL